MRTADVTTALLLVAGGILVLWDSVRIGSRLGHRRASERLLPVLARDRLARLLRVPSWSRRCGARTKAVRLPGSRRRRCSRCWCRPSCSWSLIQFVGLYVATALYMGFYMRWIGRHGWLAVVAVSIGVPVVTFVVFEMWFLVPMPKGSLEAWLGY